MTSAVRGDRNVRFASSIKKLMQRQHWTITILHDLTGIAESSLRRYREGYEPRTKQRWLLMDFFGVTEAELMGEDDIE